jgi:hypothetical protein
MENIPPPPVTGSSAPRRRRRLNRKRLALVLSIPLCLTLLVVQGSRRTPSPPPEPLPVKAKDRANDCAAYPFKSHSRKLRDRLPAYKLLSVRAGIRPIADDAALRKALEAGRSGLVPVSSNTAFWVAPMDHGWPYLTPAARDALLTISRAFQRRIADTDLADARIKVTSLFRTRRDQRELGRSNVNATRDSDAPHTHGTSMDLSYMKFVDQDGAPMELLACQQAFLAETLAEVVAEQCAADKRIFATREAKQACYHISVCR